MTSFKNILLFLCLSTIFPILSQATTNDSIREVVQGEWFTKDKHFIVFEDNRFSHNLGSRDTLAGTWKYNAEKKSIEFTKDLHFNKSIDSTVLISDSTGECFLYYCHGEHIASKIGDQFIRATEIADFTLTLENNVLILREGENGYELTKPTKLESTTDMAFSLMSIFRGLIGMAFLIIVAWLFSANRSAVNWGLVGKGLLLQLIIALLVLKVPAVAVGFDYISAGFVWVIGMTDSGVNFLFGQFGIGVVQAPLLTFAIKVLPTIIFFSALVSLFYYWGILQKIVYLFAWVMKKFMRLSGAESLAAAGNVFLGQTEAPLLVKPYLMGMTKSEIMCLMTGGMATIAGGVLAAYVNFLGGDDPVQQAFFAKHLLTASIISAPAAIIAAKILVPETETINEKLTISKEKIGTNALEAISNGTSDGLRLAVNVGAMLLVFIAIMALGNGILGKIGDWTGLNEMIAAGGVYGGLSFEFLLGYACRPVVWLMGVEWADSVYVGELLGTKTVLNEFVAYPRLGEMKEAGLLSQKSIIMSTYMLCGFANFASIGIQIGGIGALVPSRKGLLSKLGMRALIGGTIACLMTAVIVGMTM
ncbi:MAG: nucleoside transporter C-terminal domain-containing protein [Crocinitomicaceae bacterium]|nr:nucleoside transporter C-terminal domain-containing protein [Crocinitomicaceae bacterium]